jgi:hypothetical protein
MDKVIFTRLELYNLVWQFQIAQIAKKYDISSMSIKNACHKMQIPLPGSRELLRLKNNRSNRPMLSEDYKGNTQIGILKKTYDSQLRKISKLTPLNQWIKNIESDSGAPIQVAKKLTNPTDIIFETQLYLESRQFDNNSQNEPENVLCLNIETKNIKRSLLFLDALIKLLQYRGHRFEKSNDKTGLIFMNNEIEIEIDLREGLKRIPPKMFQDTSQYIKTEILIFQIRKDSYKKEWRDGRISLEKNLVSIVANLELVAAEEKQWKEDCEIRNSI